MAQCTDGPLHRRVHDIPAQPRLTRI